MIVKGKSYPHRYTPIISQSLFEQVQQVKDNYKKKPYKFAGLPFLYRGLIRCDICGLSVSPERHKGYAYYCCTEYHGKHGAKWIREEKITKQLAQVFKSLQMPKSMRDEIIPTLQELHQNKVEFHNKQFKQLIKEQAELSKMMDNLYFDKLKGKISDEQYDKFHKSFVDKKDEIAHRLSKLQEAESNYFITAKYILELTEKAYDLFISSEVDEKRQLIKLVLQNVRFDGENIVYEAHKPFDLMIKATDSNLWRG